MKCISTSAGDWLSLTAAPTFALMALLTLLVGDSHLVPLCTQAGQPSALTGMVPMYLLMAIFHLTPWFRLCSSGQ
jgi:hypothetical protein